MNHPAAIRSVSLRVPVLAALLVGSVGVGRAAGDVVIKSNEIFSPFDDALVTVEWGDVQSRFSGYLRWANPTDLKIGSLDTNLFNLDKVSPGDLVKLPRTFSLGQELIFGFADTLDGKTLYTHKDPEIAVQIDILARSRQEYLIFASGTPTSDGKSTEMDNAMMIVRFAQLPSPGTGVFIGTLMLAASRRR